MPHSDWREPVARLRARLSEATAGQRALAEHLGVRIPDGIPALLAAAMLRDALGSTVDASPKPASSEQLDYVDDLTAWARPEDPPATTRAIASALLTLLETRRALESLEALELQAGDIVVEWHHSDRLAAGEGTRSGCA